MSYTQKSDFYIELARISSILLAALFALMAFLLVVGVQNPENNIETLMYATVGSLGLNLVLSVVGNLLAEHSQATADKLESAASRKKADSESLKVRGGWLSKFRVFQQLVFIFSVVFVIWLAVAVTQFFFKPVPAAPDPTPPSGTSQQAPSSDKDHPEEQQPSPTPAP